MKTPVPLYESMNGIPNTRTLLSATITCVTVICTLLVLNLLSANLGIASASVFHLITIFLLLGILLLNLPLEHTVRNLTKKNPHLVKLVIGIVLLLCAFLLLIFSKTQMLWISSIPLLICGLDLSLEALDQRRKELRLLAVASFGCGLVYLLLETIPFAWYLYQQSSLLVSHAIGIVTGTPLALGPTASGLGILFISLIFIISVFFLTFRKTRKDLVWYGISIAGLFFIWFFYLILLDLMSFESKNDTISLHPLFFLFCLIPVLGILLRYRVNETSPQVLPQKSHMKQLLKNGAVWAAVLLFLSTTVLTSFVNTGASSGDQQKIIFYGDHMLGTWDAPEYGKYGKDAVGMFGLWPVYLTTLGYETEIIVQNRTQFLSSIQLPDQNITRYLNLTDYTTIIETEKITKTMLDGATVFVVSNLNVSFSKEEQAVIWEYVSRGGSLLVIGDHTNVGGIQGPLNEMLTPVGISFRFDAALPLDDNFKWLTCTHLLYHPITTPLTSFDELQYGVGASLDVSPTSFPIVIGSSALSDSGNRTNGDIAYLGDYEYNKGEQLGDVILVAGAYYGSGKVLVFGDTSSFQNPALPFSYLFVQSTFTWLANKQTATTSALQIGISLLFLIGAALIYRLSKYKTISFALFPIVLCFSLLMTTSLNPLLISSNTIQMNGNIVLVDASHGERFALESFTDTSVNGLIVNLQRNNYLPILLRQYSEEKISASKILVFIAPTSSFTPVEVMFLQQYMRNGGFVILATGYEDKDASLPLLQAFDVDVRPTPLGPVPYVEGNLTFYQNEPRFVDSWPLSIQENQTTSYYNFTWDNYTFHLVVFEKHGAGGLLVIGDSQYLLDKNIESIYDYWPGNILFLKYLLNELQPMEDVR
ncbi:MAG TPA: hypothetical protein DSN98_06990 [Thermoplasmata archaeon]|nr:MAG TPA: hypothetical protein DSN98_06990 [Thermoplasmata archaeon]